MEGVISCDGAFRNDTHTTLSDILEDMRNAQDLFQTLLEPYIEEKNTTEPTKTNLTEIKLDVEK